MSKNAFKRKPGDNKQDTTGVEGYLEKKGEKHNRVDRPRWSQRYFRLQGTMLEYYTDSDAAERATATEPRKELQALEPPMIMKRARKLLEKNKVTQEEFDSAMLRRQDLLNQHAVAAQKEALIELIVAAEARNGRINLQNNPRVRLTKQAGEFEIEGERLYQLRCEKGRWDDAAKWVQALELQIEAHVLAPGSAVEAEHDTKATRKALDIRIKLYGERDLRTTEAMLQLSGAAGVDNEEEFELLIRCLDIRKDLLPANDILIGQCLKAIGRFMIDAEEDVKAGLPFMQKSLEIYEHNDPEARNIDTVNAMNELACALESNGRIHDARMLFERSFTLSRKLLGDRHSETASLAGNLAMLLITQFSEEVFTAVLLQRLKLKVCELVLGTRTLGTAEARMNLGRSLLDSVKLSKAPASAFGVGDRVQLLDNLRTNRELAKQHGGWDDDMDGLCGAIGTVKRIDADAGARVVFD